MSVGFIKCYSNQEWIRQRKDSEGDPLGHRKVHVAGSVLSMNFWEETDAASG